MSENETPFHSVPAINHQTTDRLIEECKAAACGEHRLGAITLKDSGARQTFDSGANRDVQTGKGRFDLLPPWAIEQLAKLYEAGCLKYGDRNWEKGIPLARYLDSGLRHAFKALRGDSDEDHLLAACWNLLCALETRERIRLGILPRELDNLPRYETPPPPPNENRMRRKLP